MALKVDPATLHSLSSQLQNIATALGDANTQAYGQVQNVVGASWEGDASIAFGAMFDNWKNGFKQVEDALSQISTALTGAGTSYEDTEAGIKQGFGG